MDESLDQDKRRLLKAFHAFKCDPSYYNFFRIEKAVKIANNTVYVENAVNDFTQSLSDRPKYSGFSELFESLQVRE